MLLIKNGNLITMAGMYEQTGDILIDDGKIVKVGQVGEVPEDCQIIDAAGRTVTPGLVDPHCHAGLWEPPAARKWTEMSIRSRSFRDCGA